MINRVYNQKNNQNLGFGTTVSIPGSLERKVWCSIKRGFLRAEINDLKNDKFPKRKIKLELIDDKFFRVTNKFEGKKGIVENASINAFIESPSYYLNVLIDKSHQNLTSNLEKGRFLKILDFFKSFRKK